MPSLLPTPEPADPVEGQPGHFEHSNWLKASVKALDSGVVHKSDTWNETGTANPAFVPSTTTKGYPYAKPADPLVQWPATSQQLAQRVDQLNKIIGGTYAGTTDGASNIGIPVAAAIAAAGGGNFVPLSAINADGNITGHFAVSIMSWNDTWIVVHCEGKANTLVRLNWSGIL